MRNPTLSLLLCAAAWISPPPAAAQSAITSFLPADTGQLYRQGRLQLDAQRWSEAEASFRQFVAENPRSHDAAAALYYLAFVLRKSDRPADADQELRRLVRDYPNSDWAKDALVLRVELAGQLGNTAIVDEALASPYDDVKAAALQQTLRHDPAAAVNRLADVLAPGSHASDNLKELCLTILAKQPTPAAAPLLIALVAHSPSGRQRQLGVAALGAMDTAGARQFLGELAKDGADPALAAAAKRALAPHAPATLQRGSGNPATFSRTVQAATALTPALVDAPYAAEQVIEKTQSLADGTQITLTGATTRSYRDSQGRIRREMPLYVGPPPNRDTLSLIEISDPVAGVQYFLDTQNKVAHRFTVAATAGPLTIPAAAVAAAQAQRTPPAPSVSGGLETKSQSLGTQVIDGLPAFGWRITRTLETGTVGNDRPLVSTEETWTSLDLDMVLLRKSSDPRSGDQVDRIVTITRAEQDGALFRPTADYRLVEEAAPVTITYSVSPPDPWATPLNKGPNQ